MSRKPKYPISLDDLDKKKVEEILSMASLRELNIFHDSNKIIVALCKALLKSWDGKGR
jgi:hypothetical protein